MALGSLLARQGPCRNSLHRCKHAFNYQQKSSLVNVKLKWVKDIVLDSAVIGQADLKATTTLVSILASSPNSCLPIYRLNPFHGRLGLARDVKVSTFIRKYPNIFNESRVCDSAGTPVPCFGLTGDARELHLEESRVVRENEVGLVERLCKLLMMCKDVTLPLHTIDQLKWDMGLPYDYYDSLVPRYGNLFASVRLDHDRIGLKLLAREERLSVSYMERNASEGEVQSGCLAFPIRFMRGFGLKRKCMVWLNEWQRLPYTSPYSDSSHLDPRTDVSEKRNAGVFHELLHLMIQKKMERKNVSNLREPLSLPQKFTKVFERHPGIFYISLKENTQTIVLREAYDRQQLLYKHPLVDVRDKYLSLMRIGFLDRSRGLYKKTSGDGLDESKLECVAHDVYKNNDDDDHRGDTRTLL